MLKNIPAILSPDLLKILMEMGHGDELVIGDANFPAAANAKRLVRCDGHKITTILDAILRVFPLDYAVECPAALMDNKDPANPPVVWAQFKEIITRREGAERANMEPVERFAFYERARNAYAIVASSDPVKYGNILIKKGIVTEDEIRAVENS
ncbi:MAG: fucose isomerase [Oscillospiraceae bacterium]|jgi:L-fucose mutarotase|nr:fucose isomerase [Oscillospiraceae bacterium]